MPRIVNLNSKITPIHYLEANPKVGDIIEIRLETSTVLDEATNFRIFVKKPSSEIAIWPATQIEDRSMITYTTNPNDLSEPGKYIMQAHVEWGTSRKLTGDPDVLIVRPIGKGPKAMFEVNEMGQHTFDLHRFTSPDELFTVYLYRIDQSVQELKEDINYKIERRYDRYITIISPTLERGDRIEVIYR